MLRSELYDIQNLIDSAIHKAIENKLSDDKPEVGKYRPSMISKCLRSQYFIYKHGKKVSDDKAKIFLIGEIYHRLIQDILKENYSNVRTEVPVIIEVRGFRIKGLIDVLINDEIIIELKTTNNLKKWNDEKKHYDELREPYPEHIDQVTLYMGILGIKDAFIVYIEKNTLRTKTFRVSFDRKRYEEILDRADLLHNYLLNNTIPPAEAKLNEKMRWQCRFCEFRQICERLGEKETVEEL